MSNLNEIMNELESRQDGSGIPISIKHGIFYGSSNFNQPEIFWPKLDIPDRFEQDYETYYFIKDLVDLLDYRQKWTEEFLRLNPNSTYEWADSNVNNEYYYKDSKGIIYSGDPRPAIVYDSKNNACCTCGSNLFTVVIGELDSWTSNVIYKCSQCGTEG